AEAFAQYPVIITVEDGVADGGAGSAILEWAMKQGYNNKVLRMGIPDAFIPHGSIDQQLRYCQLDAESIAQRIAQALGR
ncbi:MAG TPA: transketolase C-terminal domain-containing protein, partial [Bacteroidales bacterium]|nr:transketolase C-terminal domain-containing protein [Bacteroidales bacterium]